MLGARSGLLVAATPAPAYPGAVQNCGAGVVPATAEVLDAEGVLTGDRRWDRVDSRVRLVRPTAGATTHDHRAARPAQCQAELLAHAAKIGEAGGVTIDTSAQGRTYVGAHNSTTSKTHWRSRTIERGVVSPEAQTVEKDNGVQRRPARIITSVSSTPG